MNLGGIGVCVAVLLTAAVPKGETGTSELRQLEGDWITKSFLIDGGPPPRTKPFPDRVLTIKGDGFSEFRGGKVAIRGTLKLDSTKSPKWIDATLTQGGPTGETVRGIYERDGDALKVCVGTPETERPARFESKSGSKLRLILYGRKRP